MDRLLTTPRYWATVANPAASSVTAMGVRMEIEFRTRLMRTAATNLRTLVQSWRAKDGQYSTLVAFDTNFWVDHNESIQSTDWHGLLGPKQSGQDELRIVVPLIVVDELDKLTHNSRTRSKVVPVLREMYELLGRSPWHPVETIAKEQGRGDVNLQLLFDPPGHVRLPLNDDELIARVVALRDFLGVPVKQCHFVTQDRGAAFRASAVGLGTRLIDRSVPST